MIIHDSINHTPGEENRKKNRFLKIRNLLNIIFMLLAIIGVIVYCFHSHNYGIIIVLVSMTFKFVECCLRLIR